MKHKRGFTIIELLVVVSIIALLTAILLPSLDTARRMARKVICSHSLKGIGLGWQMYQNDYPKQVPEAVGLPMDPPDPADIHIMDVMAGYVSGPNVWECPGDDQDIFKTLDTSYEYYIGYMLTLVSAGGLPIGKAEIIEMVSEHPDIFAFLGDAEGFHPTPEDPDGRLWCYFDGHVGFWGDEALKELEDLTDLE